MPLLSLPNEILLNIIGLVARDEKYPNSSIEDGGPRVERRSIRLFYGPIKLVVPTFCFHNSNRDAIYLSQTCQHLRNLSITITYSQLNIFTPDRLTGLRIFLALYPPIAAYVRHLYITARHISMDLGLKNEPPTVSQEEFTLLVRDILQSCKNLRSLKFGDSDRRPQTLNFDSTTLEHLAIESKRSLELIALTDMGLLDLFEHLKRVADFRHSSPRKMAFFVNPCGPEEMAVGPLAFGPTALRFESVRSFSFGVPFSDKVSAIHQRQVGEFFAKATPCVTVLTIASTPDCIHGAMSTYANLGSRLTKLTLCTTRAISRTASRASYTVSNSPRNHICPIVSNLAPSLTDLVLKGVLCHELFTASEWPHIATINLNCLYGCEGHNPTILRKKVKHLTITRPRTLINIHLRYRTLDDISSYRDKWDMLEKDPGPSSRSEDDWWKPETKPNTGGG